MPVKDLIIILKMEFLLLKKKYIAYWTGSLFCQLEAAVKAQELCPPIAIFYRTFLISWEKNFSENYEFHFIGSVCGIDLETIRQAASDSKLTIIPPFSLGEKGRLWILDPIQVAFEVATRLRAKIFFVLDTFPLPNFDNTDSSEFTTDSITKWLEKEPDLPSAQKIQLTALTEACVRWLERCHLLDGSIEGALLAELLTPKGTGVMITNC